MSKYPDWNIVTHNLFSQFKNEFSEGSKPYVHFNKQYRKLNRVYSFNNLFNPLLLIKTFEFFNLSSSNENETNAVDFIKNEKERLNLVSNGFYAIGNSLKSNFIYVDDKVEEVLKINPEEFTFDRICGIDKSLNLFHPEDVSHVIRFGIIAFFVSTIEGLEINLFKDHYSAKFRILLNNNHSRMVHRKSYLCKSKEIETKGTTFLDHWIVDSNDEKFDYVKTAIYHSNEQLNEFLNALFYIVNAKLLDYTMRDILLISLLKYPALKDKVLMQDEFNSAFTLRQLRNFNTILKKKINKDIKQNTLKNHPIDIVLMRDSVFKSQQLGLYPVSSCILKLINTSF